MDGGVLKSVRVLSKNEFDGYREMIRIITKLDQEDGLFKILRVNYLEFKDSLSDHVTNYVHSGNKGDYLYKIIPFDLNRLIMNFLSSVRMFVDHTETRLKHEYGRASDEVKFWELETKTSSDKSFAYRFLWKLRNYAQHLGIPAGSINLNSRLSADSTPHYELLLSLQRDTLLQYNRWGSQVTEELSRKPPTFDIIPLIDELFEILSAMHENLGTKIYPQYLTVGNTLITLIRECEMAGGIPGLFETIGSGEKCTINITNFPFDFIGKITGVQINILREDSESI
jgi:hypothetical protein